MERNKFEISPKAVAFDNCYGVINCTGEAKNIINICFLSRNQIDNEITSSNCLTETQKEEIKNLLNEFESTKKTIKLKNFLKGLSKVAFDFSLNILSGYIGMILLGS